MHLGKDGGGRAERLVHQILIIIFISQFVQKPSNDGDNSRNHGLRPRIGEGWSITGIRGKEVRLHIRSLWLCLIAGFIPHHKPLLSYTPLTPPPFFC